MLQPSRVAMAALEGCSISHRLGPHHSPAYAAPGGAVGQVVPGGIPCPTTSNATLYAVLVAFSAIQGACSSMHYVSLSGGAQGE